MRRGDAQRLEQQHVLRCIRDVIVAAYHVCDAHLRIVHHDGEVIRRVVVGAQDDEVFDVGGVERDRPLDRIVERGIPRRTLNRIA